MDSSGVFTYDSSLSTARDRIRLAVGDTDATNPLRWDETIDALLTLHGEATATALIARSLANQYAQEPSNTTLPGGLTVSYSDRVKSWLSLAGAIEKDTGMILSESDRSVSEDFRVVREWETATSEYQRPFDLWFERSW